MGVSRRVGNPALEQEGAMSEKLPTFQEWKALKLIWEQQARSTDYKSIVLAAWSIGVKASATQIAAAQREAAIATLDKCYPKDAEDGNAVPFMRKQYMEWINEHFPGGETDG